MNFNCSMPALITSLALALAPQLSSSELSLVAAALTQLATRLPPLRQSANSARIKIPAQGQMSHSALCAKYKS